MSPPKLIPISARCPTCGSSEIFYTCHVTCCFNHLCNDCRTTFELSSHVTGRLTEKVEAPSDRDTSLPMAPCASCGKSEVFQIEGAVDLVCAACGSLLVLDYEKIAAG